jgi:hypothetical protein
LDRRPPDDGRTGSQARARTRGVADPVTKEEGLRPEMSDASRHGALIAEDGGEIQAQASPRAASHVKLS